MKFARPTEAPARAGSASAVSGEGRTRDAVAKSILESGPLTAASLAERLQLSPAGIRRHLDALVADGILTEVEPRATRAPRGRGRPARAYALTDAGRGSFAHAYDDLASTALRYLRDTGGEEAVRAFADHRAKTLADRITTRIADETPPDAVRSSSSSDSGQGSAQGSAHTPAGISPRRVAAVAGALTDEGYAATFEPAGHGMQICQHHCPVAHVASEFPELCEAETRALAEVLGTYVQRLATIARGDGVCTTHVPATATASTTRTNDLSPMQLSPLGRQ